LLERRERMRELDGYGDGNRFEGVEWGDAGHDSTNFNAARLRYSGLYVKLACQHGCIP